MKFNKKPSFIKSVLTLVITSGFICSANAADGKINFTGKILDSACTVETSSASQTVNLGQVPRTAFTAAGDVAAATRFNIVLNSCPDTVKSASIKFDGQGNQADANILALNSGETAKGVGIALYEADGTTAIPLSTESKSVDLTTAEGNSNTLTYVAKYKATQDNVEAGSANATSDFTITYQ